MAGEYDTTWRPWPNWNAVWVGALAAIAVRLLIGLIGFAVGPMLLVFGALDATANFGGWYTGLAGTPVWANIAVPPATPETAAALRNAALILLWLLGAPLGLILLLLLLGVGR
jgi:hypothetical protein